MYPSQEKVDWSSMMMNENDFFKTHEEWEESERELLLQISLFRYALSQSVRTSSPHVFCDYLYQLVSSYHAFYEKCPILRENMDEGTMHRRLILCALVDGTLRSGLHLVGVPIVEQM